MSTFHRAVNATERMIEDAARALHHGQPRRAADIARQAAETAPDRLDLWWLWGLAAMAHGAYSEADQALSQGLARIPADHPLRPRFLTQRVRVLSPCGRHAEACELARQALAAGADDAECLASLAMAFGQAGCEHEALPLLARAAELAPQSAALHQGLGDLQQFLGLIDAAELSYMTALRLTPNSETCLALARLKRWTAADNHIATFKALEVSRPLDEARRAYALFKELDDIGDYDQAWSWLDAGARAARRQPVTLQTLDWSREGEAATAAAWKTYFPADRFDGTAAPQHPPRRIFIVGLPRSGTTLVERILAAHSRVRALGEPQTFLLAVKRLSGATGPTLLDPTVIAGAARQPPELFAEFYDLELAYLTGDAACTIDKLPYNHDYVGLIRLAFPDAAIIHVRRAPMDSLFGAYRLHVDDNYRWSFDQNDLADHYEIYRDLMRHWTTCLGDSLIEVSLEAIIADPETQIRRLLAACRLPFEAACLAPHTAGGAVASASSVQVRRPINADGVGAWRRYAAQLEPLKQRLMAMGAVDNEGNPLS